MSDPLTSQLELDLADSGGGETTTDQGFVWGLRGTAVMVAAGLTLGVQTTAAALPDPWAGSAASLPLSSREASFEPLQATRVSLLTLRSFALDILAKAEAERLESARDQAQRAFDLDIS